MNVHDVHGSMSVNIQTVYIYTHTPWLMAFTSFRGLLKRF